MNERSLTLTPEAPDRRGRILQVAGRLFSQKGYHGSSMRELASALGLTQSSLYNHVANKEELLLAIVDGVADEFLVTLEPVVRSAASPTAKLRSAVRVHLQIIAEHLETATVFLHEWKFLSATYRARVESKRGRYEALWREIIAEGVERGDFRPLKIEFTARWILSTLNWTYQWYSPQGALTAEEIADRYLDLFLHGLLKS
ncbi:MAG TPA: TetR/AcrR family transcriptional regulator [Candidatus Fraserbacteria bacterium]|mgnify:CR=1 FL=1|nr:TetR/AcrR family transcriptional regulator [Candidatus Fraserbacteria bacterium]